MELFEKFYNKTLRFLSFRPRSEKEIRDYLLRHSGKRSQVPSGTWRSASRIHSMNSGQVDSGQARMTIIKVIAKLKEQNFINDEEFTKWWIERRTQFRPRGLRVIKLELRQKGIDETLIEKILSNKDLKILGEGAVKNLIEKRVVRYKNLPKHEAHRKMSEFLLRRGFDWETIKKAVDEVLGK